MSPEEILKTEFSEKFVTLMKNRMIVSYFKYGHLRDAYPERVDALASLMQRIKKFEETKNTEYLVDVANFAMIAFMFPKDGEYFQGTDSSGSPGRIRLDKQDAYERNIPVDKSVEKLRERYRNGE